MKCVSCWKKAVPIVPKNKAATSTGLSLESVDEQLRDLMSSRLEVPASELISSDLEASDLVASDVQVQGVGTDLLDQRRIEAILKRHPQRFAQRMLTTKEHETWSARGCSTNYVAKRFCAKEAVAKALGTGIAKGVSFQDIHIASDTEGATRGRALWGRPCAGQRREGAAGCC